MEKKKSFQITDGFLPEQKERAVELFWQAFKGKLHPVMKPEHKALEFLNRVVDPGHAMSATDAEGRLLGVAGFKTDKGAFIGGSLKDICQVYGPIGGIWRGSLLSLLERPLEPGTLLMDGLFVSDEARGQGVGSELLSAIKAKAQRLGDEKVRLDVINTNPRARALYERHGFKPISTDYIGLFHHIFRFKQATIMTCQVT